MTIEACGIPAMMANSIEAPLTLYEKICDYLREGIQAGVLPAGTRIESEAALMKRFGVSRITVRNAISRLVREGLLVRRQGKGTFVSSLRLEYRLGELYGTAEVLARHGLQPRMKVLSYDLVDPEPPVLAALGLGVGEKVLRIERQDLAGDVPVGFAIIYLPEWLSRQLAPGDLAREPLYRLLWNKARIFVDRGTQTLRAAKADFKVATLLSVPVGDPVMLAQRTAFARDDTPVEYATVYYRSEAIHFTIELKRSQPSQDLQPTAGLRAQLNMDQLNRSR